MNSTLPQSTCVGRPSRPCRKECSDLRHSNVPNGQRSYVAIGGLCAHVGDLHEAEASDKESKLFLAASFGFVEEARRAYSANQVGDPAACEQQTSDPLLIGMMFSPNARPLD